MGAGMSERAAIYNRVSTPGQEEGTSLAGQYERCRTYCDGRYCVVRVYREVGSGMDPNRAGLMGLLHQAKRGAFDVVVVYQRDRFGRDPVMNSWAITYLKRHGVRLEATDTGQRPESPEQEFFDLIMDGRARLECRITAGRCQLGRDDRAREGRWPTRVPYGYRRHGKGRLVIHEPEARLIRRLFRLVAEGLSLNRAATRSGMNYQTSRGRIHSTTYRGLATYNGISMTVPAIVDEQTWHAAQDALDATLRSFGRSEPRDVVDDPAPPTMDVIHAQAVGDHHQGRERPTASMARQP